MAAQLIRVAPPAMLEAAVSAGAIAERAAAPHPGVLPTVSPGSPADGAVATIAVGMSARTAQLSAQLAGKGPQVQATTQTGVAQLRAQDQHNAAQIDRLTDGSAARNTQPHAGIQAVDHTWKREPPPPPPPPKPPVEGLPPQGIRPPVDGTLTPGPASRPSAAARGGQSLYDEHGGEWRYFPGDRRHNLHWDYKPRPGPGGDWDNIPIGGLPPLKETPDPSIVSNLPPWLVNPSASAPAGTAGPPQNPLLAPFPGATMPPPPPPAPGPGLVPHVGAPHIDVPQPSPGQTEVAGGGPFAAAVVGRSGPRVNARDMTAPFDPTTVSSLAQQIAEHVGPLDAVGPEHLQLWLPALPAPPAWTVVAVDGVTVMRLLLRGLSSRAYWDGCEVLNVYRVPATVPESLVLDNADRILRDSGATDMRSHQLQIAAQCEVIATRASGVLHSGERVIAARFHNYVVNTTAGAALIEQAIVIGAEVLAVLDAEADELTEGLYRSLLASIERASHREQE